MIRFKAEASAWTPAAVQLQQVWVDPQARRQRLRAAGRCATSAGCCSRRSRPSASSSGPRTTPALRLYDSIGMTRELTYRSLVF